MNTIFKQKGYLQVHIRIRKIYVANYNTHSNVLYHKLFNAADIVINESTYLREVIGSVLARILNLFI